CTFFGASRERFLPRIRVRAESQAGGLTRLFSAAAAPRFGIKPRGKAFEAAAAGRSNLIDRYIFADLQTNNIMPADRTTDYEFMRRVTLDLTGRIPTPDRVIQFVQDPNENKRVLLIDALLATPEWTDKWTMFFGDLYKNTANAVQVRIQPEGRNAFYKYLHDSLAVNKPYNTMASEMIAANGKNSFDQTNGQINYHVLGVVGGGPTQDIFDSQAANVASQFLGLAHVNCLLCHNGRGHLETLTLWGSQKTRVQAWGLAAFMAHTKTTSVATPADPNNPNARYNYFSLDKYTTDYNLNTTSGNRPARQPIGPTKAITPTYMFGGQTPGSGEDYRVALARYVTGDFQFARATVNYIWAALFGRGVVDPPDQFDPARLDPDNPPPAPWTLQPSNARLLNALAQSLIDSGYNIKALQRTMLASDTYQLASEYSGTWDPAWEQYFARHFVRRLMSEEVHDSIVTAIGTLPGYTVNGFTNASTVYGVDSPGFGKISYAMQAPDVVNMPDNGGAVSQFLDAFLRGNRDDQPRKTEGSILQALGLMNDAFVQNRIHATGTGPAATFLAKQLLNYSDEAMVNNLFLHVLSRPPAASEKALALAQLAKGGAASRKTNAEDLLWTLFNKVDFVFNY
ncbi:MAG: hypothetical protein QOJ99_5811, partial [Bryobacterales bacterium]|nr:hypothetical protein [Bryobacterales bacterium]